MPAPATVQPWQYAIPTEEALKRNPANVIPPQFRPRVPLRFDAQNTLLVSGLLDGGGDIAQRPVVVDVPVGKGHVVLFASNPIYRGETRRQLLHGVQRHPELRQPRRGPQAGSAIASVACLAGGARRLGEVIAPELLCFLLFTAVVPGHRRFHVRVTKRGSRAADERCHPPRTR